MSSIELDADFAAVFRRACEILIRKYECYPDDDLPNGFLARKGLGVSKGSGKDHQADGDEKEEEVTEKAKGQGTKTKLEEGKPSVCRGKKMRSEESKERSRFMRTLQWLPNCVSYM